MTTAVGRGAPTAHDIFRGADARLGAAVRPTAFRNLALAPADPLFEHGEGLRDEGRLRRALAEPEIASNFDVVLLDTPPSLDILLLNALTAANWVVVPFVPHPLSREGVKQLMRVLFKIISGPNQQLRLAGFLPVMGNDHIRVHRTVTNDVEYAAVRRRPPAARHPQRYPALRIVRSRQTDPLLVLSRWWRRSQRRIDDGSLTHHQTLLDRYALMAPMERSPTNKSARL